MRSPRSASGCCYRSVDWQRLQSVWGLRLWRNLSLIASGKKRYELMMVGGSFVGYTRSTRQWWSPVERLLIGAEARPAADLFRLLEHAQLRQRPDRHGHDAASAS